MDETRDLALLRSGIREIVTLKPRDPGLQTANKCYSDSCSLQNWQKLIFCQHGPED